jgi:hypothetical protein
LEAISNILQEFNERLIKLENKNWFKITQFVYYNTNVKYINLYIEIRK